MYIYMYYEIVYYVKNIESISKLFCILTLVAFAGSKHIIFVQSLVEIGVVINRRLSNYFLSG